MAFLHAFLECFAVADNAGFDHFAQQVVTFTGTFTYSGKYGESVMFLGDIIDKFLDQYGFSHTGAAEQTDFTTFGIRFEQVDHFDTREKHLLHSCQILKFRGGPVNGIRTVAVESFHTVDRITDYVHQSSFNLFAYRHSDRASGGIHFHASLKSVGTIHRYGTHRIFADMLLNFYNQYFAVWPLYLQCVVDAWQHQFRIRTFKVHIDHRADHLRDMSDNL